ncbi:TetR/AcrR family transcriptional regulator [Lacticaseibacillus hegangensis]|uniref:TetR/AcrR family transcriptional regulator n=1 Tax=Lacticaseibacillus hegangensis TaxID=2486010 RepID=A0ABW4CZ39_9LACO|nr:TetR/AcrR family transcriptional regulator [Lacticaseibacillus hegangensis]
MSSTNLKIQAALLKLMTHSDYTDITVTAVAKQAGIDRRTFYRHYPSVAAVLAGFENDIISTIMQTLAGQTFSTERFIAGMNKNIARYYDFFDDMAVTQKHAFFFDHSVNNITHILEAALGRPATMNQDEFYMRIRFVAAGIVRVYLDWLRDGQPVSLEDLTKQLDTMVTAELAGMKPKAPGITGQEIEA